MDFSGFGGGVGGLVGGYFQNESNRAQGRVQKIGGQIALSQAVRNRMLAEYDAKMGQRQAEEAAAQSGVYDPSDAMNVGAQSVRRVTDRNNILLQGASEQEGLAQRQLSAIKRAIAKNRGSYYANMGLHLFNAGLGAYNMWPQGGQTGAQIAAQSHSNATGLPASMFKFE